MDPVVYESVEPSELPELPDETISDQPAHIPMQDSNPWHRFNYKQDSTAKPLPIAYQKKAIISSIRERRVTIIEGNTGCGKTTHVPIFVAQDCSSRREKVNIVVTQPRRIAATSVARYVAQLCNSQLGKEVGYQIALDRKHAGPDTVILFCTTGVLLQKIIHSKSLSFYTHIIIDEVHERDIDTDILLMAVRKLMWEQNPDIKLILMSASFESERVKEYFTINYADPALLPFTEPKLIKVEGTPAKLLIFHLDVLRNHSQQCPVPPPELFKKSNPKLLPQLYDVCSAIIDLLDLQEERQGEAPGGVLAFLPGLHEINQMKNKIESKANAKRFQVLILHSCINDSEQQKIFQRPKSGVRKIILATNIAESSITVPDISYVVDFCLTKQLILDETTNLPTLKIQWATQANLTQRAGRAGRVCDGRVYRLVYSSFSTTFANYPTPEICRCPLDLAVLKTKILALGSPKELLAFCLDPPPLEGIRSAVLKLKRTGALTVKMPDDSYDHEDGQLTALGKIMSNMPIDVVLTKLVCLGFAFGLLEDCVSIAACLSVNSIFYSNYNTRLETYKIKFDWSERSFCDLLTFRNIMNEFLNFNEVNREFMNDHHSIENWAEANYVNYRRIIEAYSVREEIFQRLNGIGIVQESDSSKELQPDQRDLILKCIIAGAFYPHYFLRHKIDPSTIEVEANPYNSIVLSKLPKEGVIYARQIQDLFRDVSCNVDMKFFDRHVVVIFPKNDSQLLQLVHQKRSFLMPRKSEENRKFVVNTLENNEFSKSVYVSLMMKELSIPMVINTLDSSSDEVRKNIAILTEERNKIQPESSVFYVSSSKTLFIPSHPPPAIDVSSVDVRVTYVQQCGRFWAQVMPHDADNLYKIRNALVCFPSKPVEPNSLCTNMPCIYIPKEEDLSSKGGFQEKWRAVVQYCIDPRQIFIRLVDTGESLWTSIESLAAMDLKVIPEDSDLRFPALAIECQLIRIKPLHCHATNSSWSAEATYYFKQLILTENLILEVYSYENGVLRVSCSVNITDEAGIQCQDLSRHLVLKGFAEYSAESHLSEHDHNLRMRWQGDAYTPLYMHKTLKNISDPFFSLFNHGRDRIKLAGPKNSLQATCYGIAKSFRGARVRINQSSINAVVLEPDITFSKDRMIVAPTCSVNNGIISAINTSMMPYIRGIAPMMQLLFAPCVELRFNEQLGCYTGALSGIGALSIPSSDSSSCAYYSYDPDYDIELEFDAFITMDDLIKIQSIRYILSYILSDSSSSHTKVALTLTGIHLAKYQKKLRSELLSLLSKDRFPLPVLRNNALSYQWMSNDPSKLKTLDLGQVKNPFLPLIPWIDGIKPELNAVRGKLTQYYFQGRSGLNDLTCPLCGDRIYDSSLINQHLDSLEHNTRYILFEIHLSQEENESKKNSTTQEMDETDETAEETEETEETESQSEHMEI